MNPTSDILIVTATSVESRAVLNTFRDSPDTATAILSERGLPYHDLGLLGGQHLLLVQSEMGTMGLGASLQTVQDAITCFRPSAVVMVGLAFGVSPAKLGIGDILVSKQIMFYEPQRVGSVDGESRLTFRGSKVDVSTRLLRHFRAAELYWDRKAVKIEFGLILSGEKLIDNLEFRQRLLELEPEAIGGEMEGAGLYAACQKSAVDWILVKGICDFADGNKATNKARRQRTAASNAARFVLHVLATAPIEPGQHGRESTVSQEPTVLLGPRTRVTILLEGEFETFGHRERDALVAVVCRLVGVEESELRILSVERGSIKVTVEMAATVAGRLRDLWEARNAELLTVGIKQLEIQAPEQFDIRVAAQRALEVAVGQVGADGGALFLSNRAGRQLVIAARTGATQETEDVAISEETTTHRAWREAQTILVNDADLDPQYRQFSHGIRSELAVPLIVAGVTIGVLSVESAKPGHFRQEDLRVLELLGAHIALLLSGPRDAPANDSDPLNTENLAAIVSHLGVECAQREVDGLLRLLNSRGISTVGALREVAVPQRIENIRHAYLAETGRPAKSFEIIATLGMLRNPKTLDEEDELIKAQIAYLKAWDALKRVEK
jgi:nucleoside phosphorylase